MSRRLGSGRKNGSFLAIQQCEYINGFQLYQRLKLNGSQSSSQTRHRRRLKIKKIVRQGKVQQPGWTQIVILTSLVRRIVTPVSSCSVFNSTEAPVVLLSIKNIYILLRFLGFSIVSDSHGDFVGSNMAFSEDSNSQS